MIVMNQEDSVLGPRACTYCEKTMGYIFIYGFAEDGANLFLCCKCALRLKKILLADICELASGYRGGKLVAAPKIETVKGMYESR
jgi:hypothetical protein